MESGNLRRGESIVKKLTRNQKIAIGAAAAVIIAAAAATAIFFAVRAGEQKKIEADIPAASAYAQAVEYGTEMTFDELCALMPASACGGVITQISVNGQPVTADGAYRPEAVGELKITYTYDYSGKSIERVLTLQIEDTQGPFFTGIQDRESTAGDEVDLKAGITAEDPVDGALEFAVESEDFDVNTPGAYTMTVRAQDANGNVAEQTFTWTVKEKVQAASPSGGSGSSSGAGSSGGTGSSGNSGSTGSAKSQREAEARAEARRVVAQIITPGMSDLEKTRAIHDYIYSNVSRQLDQSNEAYAKNFGNEAYAALILKKAACSGVCKAITMMCEAAGLQCQHINPNTWGHQWNKVLVDGQWIVVDGQLPWELCGGTTHPVEGYEGGDGIVVVMPG